MLLPILRLWTGPLPKEELFPDRKVNFFVHWFAHPVKRYLAKFWLLTLQKYSGLKVIAITGSAGKTTTKDMLASILSWAGPTVVTRGNITPTYNIPDTILKCNFQTRFLILEMGVEYTGDIDFYTWLAKPDIGVITFINLTHTAHLGTQSDVIAEKSKLLSASKQIIINSDDPNSQNLTHPHLYSFGSSPDNFIQIVSANLTPGLTTQVVLKTEKITLDIHLPLLGRHFAYSAAAAAAVADILKISYSFISSGLEKFSPPQHRLQPIKHTSGAIILDDSYNASPAAVKASLNVLSELSRLLGATPVFVFGQMNELGQYEMSSHQDIGNYVKKLRIAHFLTTGPATKFSVESAGFGHYFNTPDELSEAAAGFLKPHHVILIKASRTFHFENLVSRLTTS